MASGGMEMRANQKRERGSRFLILMRLDDGFQAMIRTRMTPGIDSTDLASKGAAES